MVSSPETPITFNIAYKWCGSVQELHEYLTTYVKGIRADLDPKVESLSIKLYMTPVSGLFGFIFQGTAAPARDIAMRMGLVPLDDLVVHLRTSLKLVHNATGESLE